MPETIARYCQKSTKIRAGSIRWIFFDPFGYRKFVIN